MGKLNQVADGVWVRQSEWVWTNSIAVRGEDGLILWSSPALMDT
jgi:hypothetical protein